MQVPIFVFTGGDPLKRQDVFELIRYAADKGVKVAVTPSATPLLTREAIFKMKEAGLVRLGISLDGSTPEIHDAFRGLPGAWARTIQAIEWANEAGIPIQVHSTISRHNATGSRQSVRAVRKAGHRHVERIFPRSGRTRPTGRPALTARSSKQVFGKIYELSHRVNFQIKTTEAMHYRRYLLQHNLRRGACGIGHGHPGAVAHASMSPALHQATPQTRTKSWATRRVNDGKGFLFISHVGNVYPSGFLPIHAGNIREKPLGRHLPNAPIFKALRDTGRLEGKCGACEYKEICGGSRARAYAVTGDPLAQEPCCIYQPRNWVNVDAAEPAAVCQPELSGTLVVL